MPKSALLTPQAEVALVRSDVLVQVVTVACIMLLCAGLRAFHLGAASLWSDELFSRYYVDVFGLHYAFTEGLSTEPTPPTYYILLRSWIAMWGDSEMALRSLSAVACTLCVPVTYLLGCELFGKRQGLLAALLFALSPMSLYFSQEARVYALLMLAAALLLGAATAFLRDPRSVRAAIFYALFGILCIDLHATGVLFVASCGGAVWLSLLTRWRYELRGLLIWTGLNVLVLLIEIPYFRRAFGAMHSGGLDWMPPLTLGALANCTSSVVIGVLTPYPRPGFFLAAAVLVALLASLYFHPLPSRAKVILIGVPCLFVALVVVLSIRRPILLPRVLAWTLVPFCLIAARQLLMEGRARIYVLFSLVAALGIGLLFQVTTPGSDKEPWREALQTYKPQLERADLVVLSPLANPLILAYYAPRVKDVRIWDASLRPTIMNSVAERLHIKPIKEAEIVEAIQAKRSVWLVSNGFDLPRIKDLQSQLPSAVFQEWLCGKAPCIGVAGWAPRH